MTYEEIAKEILRSLSDGPETMADATRLVRLAIPYESETIQNGVAESLLHLWKHE